MPPLLENVTFFIAGTFPGLKQADLQDQIKTHGGEVSNKLEDVTHFLVAPKEWTTQGTKTKKVKAENDSRDKDEKIWILPVQWLNDSIKDGKLAEESNYDLTTASASSSAAAPTSKAKTPPPQTNGKSKKRARSPEPEPELEEEGNDEPEQKTKSKSKGKAKKAPSPSPDPALPPKTVKGIKRGKAAVDPHAPSNYQQTCQVYEDPSGIIYDFTLNQTAIEKNANKFYVGQVWLSTSANLYHAYFRWGRVSENGQQKIEGPFGHPDQAVNSFQRKFKDKTGSNWADRAKFVTKPKKYSYLPRDYTGDESEEEAQANGDDAPSPAKKARREAPEIKVPESTLPLEIQSLMQMIFDIRYIDATLTEYEYDSNKLPLGKLSKSTLTKGLEALNEIANVMGNQTLSPQTKNADLMRLSNQYYTFIPRSFGRNIPPVVDSDARLKKELDFVATLGDMQETQKIIADVKKAGAEADKTNPLDAQFNRLDIRMDVVAKHSREFADLQTLLANTHGASHGFKLDLLDCMRIERANETERWVDSGMDKIDGSVRLLWHGSRCSNFGGILSQGIRIAPPEAPVSGYMFGKGAYFASMSSKSAGYCYPAISGDQGLLLLCQVQLGKEPFYRQTTADYDAAKNSKAQGFLSTFGVGTTSPSAWVDAEVLNPDLKGVLVPALDSKPTSTSGPSSLFYDEHIVYDVNQVRLRYILRCKFSYSRSAY